MGADSAVPILSLIYPFREKHAASAFRRALAEASHGECLDLLELHYHPLKQGLLEEKLTKSSICLVLIGSREWEPDEVGIVQQAIRLESSLKNFQVFPILMPEANLGLNRPLQEILENRVKLEVTRGPSLNFNLDPLLKHLRPPSSDRELKSYVLRRDAYKWNQTRDDRLLYSGRTLRDAQAVAQDVPADLDESAISFLSASSSRSTRRLLLSMSSVIILTLVLGIGLFQLYRERIQLRKLNTSVQSAQALTEEQQIKQSASSKQITERLLQSLQKQGDALVRLEEWDGALESYLDARQLLKATRHATPELDISILEVHRRAPPALVNFRPQEGDSSSLALSPDGRRGVLGTQEGTAVLLDMATGLKLMDFGKHEHPVTSVAFSPDGRLVGTGSQGGFEIWDTSNQRRLHSHTDSFHWQRSIAFTPDNQKLLSGSGETLKIWDLPSGREIRSIKVPFHWVQCIAVSPDGKLAVSGGGDKSIRLWKIENGSGFSLGKHLAGVSSASFSSNGLMVASGDHDGTIHLWDQTRRSLVKELVGHEDMVTGLAFLDQDRYLLSASYDRTLRVWDVETGREIRRLAGKHDSIKELAKASENAIAASLDVGGQIRVWDLAQRRPRDLLVGHDGPVEAVVISDSGLLALSGSQDGTVRLWDVGTGRELKSFEKQSAPIREVAFSEDNRLALSLSQDHRGNVWSVKTGELKQSFQASKGNLLEAAFSSNGATAFLANQDGTVQTVDVKTGQITQSFPQNTANRFEADFSRDQKKLLLGGQYGTLTMLDLATGQEDLSFPAHGDRVTSLAFSPNRQRALSAGADRKIKLWDLQNGGQQAQILSGLNSPISSMLFLDNQRIVLGTDDAKLHFVRIEPNQTTRILAGHNGPIEALSALPGRSVVLSASQDRTIRIWDLDAAPDYVELYRETLGLTEALRSNPKDSYRLGVLGRWFRERSHWEWAIEFLEAVRRDSPETVSSLELARLYWEIGDLESAHREFDSALKRQETEPFYLRLCLEATRQTSEPATINSQAFAKAGS